MTDGNGDHSPRYLFQLFRVAIDLEKEEFSTEKNPYLRSLIRSRMLANALPEVSEEAVNALREEYPEQKDSGVPEIRRSRFVFERAGNDAKGPSVRYNWGILKGAKGVFSMAEIVLINPIAQPHGSFRLLQWLEANLENPNYTDFKMAVAFAKINPFLKLDAKIQSWKKRGNTICGIFGIDHKGTSIQALEYALNNFNEAYILHARHSTFHPKLYMFYGDKAATFFFGSNNFTLGGIETNFESGTIIYLERDKDAKLFQNGIDCFNALLPSKLSCSSKIDEEALLQLFEAGLLLDEAESSLKRSTRGGKTKEVSEVAKTLTNMFGSFSTKPPRPIPKYSFKLLSAPRVTTASKIAAENKKEKPASVPPKIPAKALVIQIIPHHNGEVFLSKTAVNQNPAFFGFPFTGETTPKKPTNPSYPQREPDPLVNIYIYDSSGKLIRTKENYSLNTVYYAAKSEIRITITPEILAEVPAYSILVMTEADPEMKYDYDLEIYYPGSQQYKDYLDACDQKLPSGGKAISRKMGWI